MLIHKLDYSLLKETNQRDSDDRPNNNERINSIEPTLKNPINSIGKVFS